MSSLVPKHLGAFILLLLVTALSFSTGQYTYYVKPTPDTPCDEDPCHTLSEYVSGIKLSSNTTMVFLPGEHTLQGDVIMRYFTKLVLRIQNSSSSLTQIVCDNNTFVFENLTSVEITGLSFISCRFHLNGSQAIFQNIRFENGTADFGGAIEADDSTIDFAGINYFEGNSAAVAGGGIFAVGSNLTFHGNTTFINNYAWYGGGVYMVESTVSFDGNNTFKLNSAREGGGVYVSKSTVSITGNNIFKLNSACFIGGGVYMRESNVSIDGNNIFMHNSAKYSGGGVYMSKSNMSFDGNNTFMHNSAKYSGGGVYVRKSNMSFDGNNTFKLNSAEYYGGGVYMKESNVSFDGNNTFKLNSAERSGGGVYIWERTVSFDGSNIFKLNSACFDGGGVYMRESNVSIDGNNIFMHNSADRGGGVYMSKSNVSIDGNNTFMHNSAKHSSGGGVYIQKSNMSFDGNNTFKLNSAEYYGGGVYMKESNVSFDGNNTFKLNSAEYYGGGVYMKESNMSLDGNNTFKLNSAEYYGGGVYMKESNVSFSGNNTFMHNSAEHSGGGVYIWEHTVSFSGNNSFMHNSAKHSGGGGVYVQKSTVSINGNNNFVHNSADSSGGGLASKIVLQFGSSIFTHNSATEGGGIVAKNSAVNIAGNCSFMYNTAQDKGGGIYAEDTTTLSIGGKSYFNGNSASYFGGGVASYHSTVDVTGRSYFTNNSGKYGGGIYAEKSNISCSGAANFLDNSVIHDGYSDGHGGAIHVLSSTLIFSGTQEFVNNSAGYGGAIALSGLDHSKMYLLSNTTMIFKGNVVLHRGGALHVEDNPFTYCIFESKLQSNFREACFFQLFEYHQLVCDQYHFLPIHNYEGIHLLFQDNVANEAGSVLYGGNLDICAVYSHNRCRYTTGTVLVDGLCNTEIASTLDISSDPYRVCVCEDNHPKCNKTVTSREVYPGGTIHVPVVAVGQRSGTTPAVIRADWEGLEIGNLQNTQITNKTCSLLQYTVLATVPEIIDNRSIILYADEPCSRSGFPLNIWVKFRPCPDGFSLSTQGRCTCEERLQRYTTECDINDQSIQRHSEFWVGFDNQSRRLIFHPHCPFDYCKSETINITLNDSDVQCDHNRSGILCGACQQHLSLTLGSSQCLPCSNTFLSLIVPFALAGFALVIFLFISKLTVAAGTISGLIFYANVVTINRNILFPSEDANILTVFIAWLNLDLGIEACFFDGMDAYIRTWLQFVFPIYIWLLVGLITVLSNVSITIAKIMGSANPVAILATLFLLSYTKLLRTIIAAFSFTTLEYPDDEIKVVWLYDGNIGYLDKNDGRHIALFLASLLVFLFLFLPYTLFLLFGQCILPGLDPNKLRCLSSNYLRMKSFLDAYHAPYQDRHRYWIGLLLLVRFILFLVSATVDIESPQDPHVNLLVIIACNIGLAIWVWNVGGMYKKWYLNALESSFILNLVLLSAATYQVKLAGGNQAAVFYTSVSIAFATFIGIIIYHVCQRVMDTRAWRNLVRKIRDTRQPCDVEMEVVPPAPRPPPTASVVDLAVLREPLLST